MTDSAHLGKLESLNALDAPVIEARFVDAERAKLLLKLSLVTIGDLLTHKPLRFLDIRPSRTIGQANFGEGAYAGVVHEVRVKRPKPRLAITEVAITDGTGVLVGVWFNQPWVQRSFVVGERVIFAGDVSIAFGLKQIKTPFVEKLGDDKQNFEGLLPVHPVTEGISRGWMRRMIASALEDFSDQIDPLPYALRARRGLISRSLALKSLHFPADQQAFERARRRLAYEELLFFELMCARKRYRTTVLNPGYQHSAQPAFFDAFAAALPFDMTEEQQKALDEIVKDMCSTHAMNRMLLGDVGTGKTLVALGALAFAAQQGCQATMMAPTEVLAQQYAAKVGPTLDSLNLSWGLLTGSTSASQRQELLARLASGELSVLFGTHALLEPDVVFNKLTLVIIDEQHRFGVQQRKTLKDKGAHPDVLLMSATPIPRTLSATAFGDLAVSRITKRPRSASGFDTHLVKEHQAYRAYDALTQRLDRGEQAYVVCALIDESDDSQVKAALSQAERLREHELSKYRVGLLTGKMRPAEKEEVMMQFKAHELDVLVATTVIEVGVDVPNATAMVILNAERFGVAQLHQLRGRVGRGDMRGDVWLVSNSFSHEAKARFEALLATDDGFKLAEFDLKQRGPGDLLGTRQSGLVRFRIADLVDDERLIEEARADAFALVSQDFDLTDPTLSFVRKSVEALERQRAEWVNAG